MEDAGENERLNPKMENAQNLHSGGSLASLLINAIERFADRPALADDDRRWSYREFGDVVGRVISVYRAHGLRAGQGVAVLSSNRVHAWAAICAATIMGMRYTPLHPMAAEEEQAFVVEDSEASALVVDADSFPERGAALRGRLPNLPTLFSLGSMENAVDLCQAAAAVDPAPLIDASSPDSLAWLMYTGGTTGRSKGVMLPHRVMATVATVHAIEWEWPSDIRFVAATPISHSAGALLYSVMYRGGFARLLKGFDAEKFCRTVERERINACMLVPTLIAKLLESGEIRARHDLSSLKLIGYGAAPISPTLLRSAIETFGPVFAQLYGQSEAPQCVMTMRIADHDVDKPRRLESCGRPTPLNQVRLLDSELNEVPTGMPGELCIRGPFVMSGYWRQPELTEEVFRGGWLHTGDVAVKGDDGFYYIVDRIKDMIISGGFNIYPREVEDALQSYPGVASAAVIGVPDEKWGEAVMAFVVSEPGTTLDAEDLRGHVKKLRGAAWAPKSITFSEALPLTSLGKLDRKALRAPYWTSRNRAVA